MELHQLERASDYQVKEWLVKELQLTPHQKSKLTAEEIIRWAPFKFYKKRQEEKSSILWRLTIIPYLIFLLILFIGIPFVFLITGRWGYGSNFYDNFLAKWMQKLKLYN